MAHGIFKGTKTTREEGLKCATRLNNGVMMPWLGLGAYLMGDDAETASRVRFALENGYRSIDTASVYGNERGVGEAVRSCGVPREEVFVTTKLWNDDMRTKREEAAFGESLDRLGLDFVDLLLLHWPIESRIAPSWKALEKIQQSGRVRAIGVSNFLVGHLEHLLEESGIVPAVNQIEFHPYLQSGELVRFCEKKKIQVESWGPLMQAGELLGDVVLADIAKKHARTVPQIVLRWNLQRGVVTIPKSGRQERMIENSDIFDFELLDVEMSAIALVNRGVRSGPDPASFNF